MITANPESPAERAQWEVLWIKNRKVQRKHCGHDLMEAVRISKLAEDAGRTGVTIRCCNMGFPPPEKYLPREVRAKKRLDPPIIIKRGRKRYRKNYEIVTAMKYPMKELNRKGIWWCPYCQKMRRFVYHKMSVNLNLGNISSFPDPAYRCPMCKVPHRDMNVRKWNPMAIQVFYDLQQRQVRAAPRDRKKEFAKKKKRRRRTEDE